MGPAVDPTSIEIGRASLQEPADQQAIIALLDHYALHPMGQSAALAEDIRARLIDGLAKYGFHTQRSSREESPISPPFTFDGVLMLYFPTPGPLVLGT